MSTEATRQPPILPAAQGSSYVAARRRAFVIALAGSASVVAASLYGASRTGLMVLALGGLVYTAVLLALFAALNALLARCRVRAGWSLAAQVALWLLPVFWLVSEYYHEGTPEGFFARLGLHSAPPSIGDFKWHGGVGIDGFYELSFTASPEDTHALARSAHLRTAEQSPWWQGGAGSPEVNLNLALSNRCLRAGFPFVWLESPAVYSSTNQSSSAWNKVLITDQAHRRVYVFVN